MPTLYFAQGMPYVVAMTVSVILYKRLGVSNADIALYTSWLYLPWVIKPLWGPLVDLVRTKRLWVVSMQLAIGVSLASIALAIPLPSSFRYTIAVFWVLAFCSATHDIAADGLYLLALEQHQQAAFVGVRSAFYRLAMITGQGLLIVLAGYLEKRCAGDVPLAWSLTLGVLALLFLLFFLYHRAAMPRPPGDRPTRAQGTKGVVYEFLDVLVGFFRREGIGAALAFLLLYRFAESQLVKMVSPFLLDGRDLGGLGLTTGQVGIAYGTAGVAALTLGGLLGGWAVSRKGLRYWLWIMVCAIHLPDAAFVYLSQVQPESFFLITCAVAVEQFGYGFGFTAYMLVMILIAEGEHKTAHYALCTGFMALGMMIPGMFSGALQSWLGYKAFFLWVMLSTVPGFVVPALVRVPPAFGKRGQ